MRISEAVTRDQWNHTASIMALLANINRDPNQTPAFNVEDFHPTSIRESRSSSRRVGSVSQLKSLKSAFSNGKVGAG